MADLFALRPDVLDEGVGGVIVSKGSIPGDGFSGLIIGNERLRANELALLLVRMLVPIGKFIGDVLHRVQLGYR
jgi:hypothetical protein